MKLILLFLILILSLSACTIEETPSKTTTTTLICPSCQQCQDTIALNQEIARLNNIIKNNNLNAQVQDNITYDREIDELKLTIQDLRGYAYNGWNMANMTLDLAFNLTSNESNNSIPKNDLANIEIIKTLSQGMEHSFRNIMGR